MKANERAVSRQLRDIVGEAGFVDREAAALNYLVDERQQYHGSALAIVIPSSVGDVARVVRTCAEHSIAIVPQGGNTGYCGGATPDDSGRQVLLNLSRLNSIRDVSLENHSLAADAGVVLSDVHTMADSVGLMFPLSMGSQGSCQIGGNLSTNAGGLAVLRYGTASDLVLGIEVVLPNGEIFSDMAGLRKDNTGYDLKRLFIGAEGTLGVITGVTLKLFPKPTCQKTAWLSLPDLQSTHRLLRFIQSKLGDCVTSFEYISRASLDYVLNEIPDSADPLHADESSDFALVELSCFDEVDLIERKFVDALAAANEQGLLTDAVVAKNESERRKLWRLRESIPAAEKQLGGSIKHDVSVRIAEVPTLIRQAQDAITSFDEKARLSVYGHIGDGNVHFNVLAPSDVASTKYKQEHGRAISEIVHGIASEFAGSFSAEHGVGQLKAALLAETKAPVALDLMRDIKRAVDPKGIMNPGKVLR